MTKLTPLILAFVLTLGAISAVALTLSNAVGQRVQALLKDSHWIDNLAETLALSHRVRGDPINDPIPNKH